MDEAQLLVAEDDLSCMSTRSHHENHALIMPTGKIALVVRVRRDVYLRGKDGRSSGQRGECGGSLCDGSRSRHWEAKSAPRALRTKQRELSMQTPSGV